jgi:hypothetical protein
MIVNDTKLSEMNQLSLRKFQNFKKSIGFLKLDIFKMSKMKKSNKVLKKMFKKMRCDETALVCKKC